MATTKNLMELDARLSEQLRVAEKTKTLRPVGVFLAHSGDSWFWVVALGILWFFGSDYWRARALALLIGILVTAILVMAIKFTVRRRRPEGEWGNVYRSTDPHSFPSGHAARATMLAVMMVGMGPTWLGVLLVIWAPLVSLARVSMGVHYLSDVIAGTIIGILIAVALLFLQVVAV